MSRFLPLSALGITLLLVCSPEYYRSVTQADIVQFCPGELEIDAFESDGKGHLDSALAHSPSHSNESR
jgi:hypothetical protein